MACGGDVQTRAGGVVVGGTMLLVERGGEGERGREGGRQIEREGEGVCVRERDKRER